MGWPGKWPVDISQAHRRPAQVIGTNALNARSVMRMWRQRQIIQSNRLA